MNSASDSSRAETPTEYGSTAARTAAVSRDAPARSPAAPAGPSRRQASQTATSPQHRLDQPDRERPLAEGRLAGRQEQRIPRRPEREVRHAPLEDHERRPPADRPARAASRCPRRRTGKAAPCRARPVHQPSRDRPQPEPRRDRREQEPAGRPGLGRRRRPWSLTTLPVWDVGRPSRRVADGTPRPKAGQSQDRAAPSGNAPREERLPLRRRHLDETFSRRVRRF